MDRHTIYFGQIPLETDLLHAEQDAMVSMASMAASVFGSTTLVNRLAVTPTGPASLNVLLTAGEIYQLENLEQSIWSSLPQDVARTILKQGILLDPITFGITPPGTVGFSQVFLVEVQYQDLDTGSLVLPYYNAANPALPFSGPGNAGTAQNTVRKGIVAAQIKAGAAAATGTQTTPTADAGWTGIYAITVANGAATITSGNIVKLTTAPFLPPSGYLPQIPSGVQNSTWTYANDTGAANALAITLNPPPASYVAGLSVIVKIANFNIDATTLNINGLGAIPVVHRDGTPLGYRELYINGLAGIVFDGTNFQLAWTSAPPNTLVQQTAITTLYVNNSTGNDVTLDGTQATVSGIHGPFKTIAHALTIMTHYNLAGFDFFIIVADGTYTLSIPTQLPLPNGSGTVHIVGNVTTPSNCLVQNTGTGSCFFCANGGNFILEGFKTTQAAIASGDPTAAVTCVAGSCRIGNWNFGVSAGSHLSAGQQGLIFIQPAAQLEVSGGAVVDHIEAWEGGVLFTANPATHPTVTISAAVTIGTWAVTYDNSQIRVNYLAINNPGNVTGKRYDIQGNAVINTLGQGGNAAYLPGTIAGTTATGGVYR